MSRRNKSIDGVVYNRKRRSLTDYKRLEDSTEVDQSDQLQSASYTEELEQPSGSRDFDAAMDEIEDDQPQIKQPKDKKKIFRRFVKLSFISVILVGGFVGYKFFSALNNIIVDNEATALGLQEGISASDLNFEGESRVNVLVIGIGGEDHPGGLLSDVNMVVSMDPENNDVAMLSIPRDLYLTIPEHGRSRINAAHAYGAQSKTENGGPELLQQTVEQMLDIKIHYYVRVDFQGFVKAIDAVGGVEVDVQKALYDPFIESTYNKFGKNFSIQEGRQKLDGGTALQYARSRKTTSDFDRALRQQQVMVALKDKVLSLGTFSNPVTLSRLLDSIGSHVKTNIQINEMLKMLEYSSKIDSGSVRQYVLDNAADGYLASRNINGAAVLVPKAGLDEFVDIRAFVKGTHFRDGYLAKENKSITVLNGSGTAGQATKVSDQLKGLGYNVTIVDDAPSEQINTIIFNKTDPKESEFTMHLLQKRLPFKTSSELPLELQLFDTDIVIVLGEDFTNLTGFEPR